MFVPRLSGDICFFAKEKSLKTEEDFFSHLAAAHPQLTKQDVDQCDSVAQVLGPRANVVRPCASCNGSQTDRPAAVVRGDCGVGLRRLPVGAVGSADCHGNFVAWRRSPAKDLGGARRRLEHHVVAQRVGQQRPRAEARRVRRWVVAARVWRPSSASGT